MLFTLTPASLPAEYGEIIVPLATAKAHLRVDSTDEDTLIGIFRDAAVQMVESYTALRLLMLDSDPDLEIVFPDGFSDYMPLARGPISTLAVTSVSYIDADGASASLQSSDWRMVGASLTPAVGVSWPQSSCAVTVTFRAGYAAANEIPAALITATLLFVGHLYANREAVVETGLSGAVPLGFQLMCDLHRVIF